MRDLAGAASQTGLEPLAFFPETARGGDDICNSAFVHETIRTLKPRAVIHLAAIAAPSEANDDLRRAFDVNLYGTMNIAQAIMAHSKETRLIFVGSSEAYGHAFNAVDGPITEDAPLVPATSYGVTKAAADLMIGQMAAQGLKAVRFRPFNHTGPGQSDAYVVAAFARQIARIEQGLQPPVMQVGNLDAERDFLDVRDVVKAYVSAAVSTSELPDGMAINLSRGSCVSISTILSTLISMSDTRIEVQQDPQRMRPSEIAVASGDASRAESVLNWKPSIPFEQTLHDVLAYWRTVASDR